MVLSVMPFAKGLMPPLPDPGLVILDRDGVINHDSDDYIKTPDEWVPIPGSLEAISRLKQAGYRVAVATNQSGLARGYFDEYRLANIHQKLQQLLAEDFDVQIDLIVWCPHGPDEGCFCRKPEPGMLHRIAEECKSDLHGIWFVGDSLKDLQAATAVGAQPVLVKTGKGLQTAGSSELPENTLVYTDLAEAADALLSVTS